MDTARFWEDGDEEERVQVEAFDEDPRIIGRCGVVETSH